MFPKPLFIFSFSPDAKASPMGLSSTLHCSVSGRGISELLRSGVYLSFSLLLFIHFISFACSKMFDLILLFGFGLPISVLRGHFCPGNVISRSMFLVWVNWKG